MTKTFSIQPNPIWYISDLTGRPAGAGELFSYRSLNKSEPKATFRDPNGMFPWTNPILFNSNGASPGPIYFEFDSDLPNEKYFLQFFDIDGQLVWETDDFPSVGGGGGNVTQTISLYNYIVNNVFWRNVGTSLISPVPNTVTLVPSNHSAFETPDIIFKKNTGVATDILSFLIFSLGSTPLTGDVTPNYYLHYESNGIAGETFKYLQFPIQSQVNNLSNQIMTFTIWAISNSGTPTLDIYLNQFFGNGGAPSPDQTTTIQTINLTNIWQKYTLTFNVPNVSGKTLGLCGDDGLYLRIQYPLSVSCNIDIAKPSLFLGTIAHESDFDSYDKVDSIINTPRTGDIRISMNSFSPFGWVIMNDGSIGSASSLATTRQNIDTFFLFKTLWHNVSDAYAPVLPGGRGASAEADFAANKHIALTAQLGRVIAGENVGGGFPLGFFEGNRTHLLTISELAAHTHQYVNHPPAGQAFPGTGSPEFDTGSGGTLQVTGSTGGNTPFSIIQPTVYRNIFIKL